MVNGLRLFLCSSFSVSAFSRFCSAFCLLCSANLAASWRRAREGGMLSGGGGGGGADGGSRSDDVAVVVEGVVM